MSDFWSRQLNGGQQPPPHVQQPPAPPASTPWWMTPAHPAVQPHTPPQGTPGLDSGAAGIQQDYRSLKAMRADQMDQGQMEALAAIELTFEKYNQVCDQCQSTNFVPAGTRIGSFRMPTAKCFECGNSSGAVTGSPEPAVGGGSGKPGRATRQLAGGAGSYGQHHTQIPTQYLPRN